jgi:acetoacetate decarboxylase
MTRDEILQAPSMPAFAPSYPHGPFRFVRREYLMITKRIPMPFVLPSQNPLSRLLVRSRFTNG